MLGIQNLGLATVILLTGVILENHGYLIIEIIFEALLGLSLFSGALMMNYTGSYNSIPCMHASSSGGDTVTVVKNCRGNV